MWTTHQGGDSSSPFDVDVNSSDRHVRPKARLLDDPPRGAPRKKAADHTGHSHENVCMATRL